MTSYFFRFCFYTACATCSPEHVVQSSLNFMNTLSFKGGIFLRCSVFKRIIKPVDLAAAVWLVEVGRCAVVSPRETTCDEKRIQRHLTMNCTAPHIKSQWYVASPGIRTQADVSGLSAFRQIIMLLRVPVPIAPVACWNILPIGSVMTVTDVVWHHPLLICCAWPSLCDDALYSMSRL